MSKRILNWLANSRNTGTSSKAMAFTTMGIKLTDNHNHPRDPADFNRCLILVRRCPEVKEAFPKIRKLSKQWAAIIDHWDELKTLFLSEAGWDWSKKPEAQATFKRMKELGTLDY